MYFTRVLCCILHDLHDKKYNEPRIIGQFRGVSVGYAKVSYQPWQNACINIAKGEKNSVWYARVSNNNI